MELCTRASQLNAAKRGTWMPLNCFPCFLSKILTKREPASDARSGSKDVARPKHRPVDNSATYNAQTTGPTMQPVNIAMPFYNPQHTTMQPQVIPSTASNSKRSKKKKRKKTGVSKRKNDTYIFAQQQRPHRDQFCRSSSEQRSQSATIEHRDHRKKRKGNKANLGVSLSTSNVLDMNYRPQNLPKKRRKKKYKKYDRAERSYGSAPPYHDSNRSVSSSCSYPSVPTWENCNFYNPVQHSVHNPGGGYRSEKSLRQNSVPSESEVVQLPIPRNASTPSVSRGNLSMSSFSSLPSIAATPSYGGSMQPRGMTSFQSIPSSAMNSHAHPFAPITRNTQNTQPPLQQHHSKFQLWE